MADNRYRERPGPGESIFDDDHDRHDRNRQSGDRGFFERAGEEVRSWFGGDEGDESRGGYDDASRGAMGSEGRMAGMGRRSDYGAYQERGPHQDYAGSYGRSYGGSSGRGEQGRRAPDGDMGQGSFSQSLHAQSPFDDHYRSWRGQQIEQLDRDYDEYRRHRQQQFESDFNNWRQTRQGATAGGRTGSAGQAEGSGTTTGQSGTARASSPAASGGSAPGEPDPTGGGASTGRSPGRSRSKSNP